MFNMLHSIPFGESFTSLAEYKKIQEIHYFISLFLIIFRYTMKVFCLMFIARLYFLVI
jgi:hypothetical protein